MSNVSQVISLFDCESCGRPIGRGRMSCAHCGAAAHVSARVTPVWEDKNNPKFPNNNMVDWHDTVGLLFSYGNQVSKVIIVNVSIERHYTGMLVNSFSHMYNPYWNNKDQRTLSIIEADGLYRFIGSLPHENSIGIFEMSKDFWKHVKNLVREIKRKHLQEIEEYDKEVLRIKSEAEEEYQSRLKEWNDSPRFRRGPKPKRER